MNPPPDELTALLILLTTVRRATDRPAPATGLGWGARVTWTRPAPAPLARRHTPTRRYGRNT
ncbi:hypothetical protein [Paractinoplanes lichenicola]|uniref:Acyl-CoA carboxylase subunit epsilon n=1 Tax=Paractinoplanes lichenicola TaxID=2802976 RepID=A0ABS1VFB4_9ACTN|nr:hypothetical protein [Actinoplanes lichenicola]MBL7253402.1 hypothetical protein [Actinoplanes lichenicola]